MNRYKLSLAGVSASEGIQRFGGNAGKYEQFLTQFPADPHFKDMCDALAARDAAAAFAAAHALKGIVGNLSMHRLYESVVPLVEALRSGDLAGADALLPAVRRDYDEVISAI